jgi:hypothetical protein
MTKYRLVYVTATPDYDEMFLNVYKENETKEIAIVKSSVDNETRTRTFKAQFTNEDDYENEDLTFAIYKAFMSSELRNLADLDKAVEFYCLSEQKVYNSQR